MSRGLLMIAGLMLSWNATARAQLTPEAQAVRAKVRASIDSGNAAYISSFAHSDAEAVARLYAADGSRMASDGVYAHGHAAIADVVQKLLSQTGPITVSLQTLDLWVIGDVAVETGRWQYAFTPTGKAHQAFGGKYVTTWRRQTDGHWRLWTDVGVPHTDFAS
jgi:uncharacterized protein (TIGR02246 family)